MFFKHLVFVISVLSVVHSTPICGENEVYTKCKLPCKLQHCEQLKKRSDCDNTDNNIKCQPGCKCIDNFLRNSNNVCVSSETCEVDDSEYDPETDVEVIINEKDDDEATIEDRVYNNTDTNYDHSTKNDDQDVIEIEDYQDFKDLLDNGDWAIEQTLDNDTKSDLPSTTEKKLIDSTESNQDNDEDKISNSKFDQSIEETQETYTMAESNEWPTERTAAEVYPEDKKDTNQWHESSKPWKDKPYTTSRPEQNTRSWHSHKPSRKWHDRNKHTRHRHHRPESQNNPITIILYPVVQDNHDKPDQTPTTQNSTNENQDEKVPCSSCNTRPKYKYEHGPSYKRPRTWCKRYPGDKRRPCTIRRPKHNESKNKNHPNHKKNEHRPTKHHKSFKKPIRVCRSHRHGKRVCYVRKSHKKHSHRH